MDNVIRDPEGTETAHLQRVVDFTGHHVLEVGCGDGRLTWRYAQQAARVTAIDPSDTAVATALDSRPSSLRERVQFLAADLIAFAKTQKAATYDSAILAWSL